MWLAVVCQWPKLTWLDSTIVNDKWFKTIVRDALYMPVRLSKNRITWSLATTGLEIEASAAANGSNDPHNLLESNAVEVTNWSSPTVSCRWHGYKWNNGNETPTHSQSMTPSNREEEIKCHQSGESWPKCYHVTHHWDPGLERRRCPRQSQESSEARVDQMAFMTFSMKSRLTGVGERLESRSCSPAASKTYKTRMLLSCDPRSLHTRISLIIFANFSRLIEPSMVRHWDFTCLRADSTAFSMVSNLPAFSGLFSFSMFSLGSKLTRAADLAMQISFASWSSAATLAGLKICFQIFSMSDRSRTSSRGCWCLTACLIAWSKTSP